MGDQFLQHELEMEMLSALQALPVNRSAFVRYTGHVGRLISSNRPSMNKRMIEILRKIPMAPESDGRYRHMIKERLRRGKQRQNYSALHSLMPPGTKNDKISIIQEAARQIGELRGIKEALQRRNEELQSKLEANNRGDGVEAATVRLRTLSPSSSIDSMIGALRCLKEMGLKARRIHSELSEQQFSAEMEIESQIEVAEVEKALRNALVEVERKLAFGFLEA